ncbi:MAG: methionyl-tRNA formyltransferase [Acidimicrobiales bacterium]|jgi:methionyl-tRNA formyltransferase
MTRLAFLGSPEVAVISLRALHDAGHDVALVVTAPDRRRGRGSALVPTPVKECALELGIPESSRVADVLDANVEIGVVVAFGTLIRPEVLQKVPMVNLHFSLLPRWRGAAPVERAILAGDDRTGVCLMALEETLDTGPVYARVEVPILPGQIASELRVTLASIGADLLVQRLAGGVATLGTPVPQVGEAVYARKIERSELELKWARPAVELDRVVRVGRAWTTFRGKRFIVERVRVVDDDPPGEGTEAGGDKPTRTAAGGGKPTRTAAGTRKPRRPAPGTLLGDEVVCGVGRLELLEVRPEGRSVQSFDEWQRGARPTAHERFGT